ncbi:hypothetical protein VTN00DRAFT_3708 [Thermoascus crustaceus]|uniref:uncharacterized protein n=1 Tax=Thermoascus crustaceus TaxID=5088 RepID=UPI0037437828
MKQQMITALPIFLGNILFVSGYPFIPWLSTRTDAASDSTNLICLEQEYAAPQRDKDGIPSVDSSFRHFCDLTEGEPVKMLGLYTTDLRYSGSLARVTSGGHNPFSISARWSGGPGCKDTELVPKDECLDRFTSGMSQCDPNSGETHGMYIRGKCITYGIEINAPNNTSLPTQFPPPVVPCVADSNQGISKEDFIEARDAWCSDTLKGLDQSKDYAKYFQFGLNKKNGGQCSKDDCIKTINSLWNTCGEYSSRPEPGNDPALDSHKGTLRGTGGIEGECGLYSFQFTDPN